MSTYTLRSTFQLIFFIGQVGLLFSLVSCIDKAVPKSVKMTLENVQQTYAPDPRIALFDVKSYLQNDTLFLNGETNLPEAHQALFQQLDQQKVIYTDQIKVLPAPALKGQIRGVVNVSVANIRSTAKHSGELATQSTLGTGLKVYKQDGDWYYVQTPDGYLGWMDSGGLTLMDENAYQGWLTAEKVIFLPDYGFVLDTPDAKAGRVGDLVAGNILLDGGKSGAFRTVIYADGRKGFVLDSEIQLLPAWLEEHNTLSAPTIVQTALSYIGRPYLWGGTSGKGMDCSGFTKTVYFMHGIVLPRDASQQINAGIAVSTDSTFSNLQAGDFLFFGQKEQDNQKEKIRHVGIYLGDGQFIHSGADNPGIKIESLLPGSPNFALHRRQTFIRARRMEVGSPGVIPIRDLSDFYGPIRSTVHLIQ